MTTKKIKNTSVVEPAVEEQDRFIEQAEFLEPDLFRAWTTEHPQEEMILRKLTQTGAKLITGPRGSGKTTLLLKAYYTLLNDTASSGFPVYVNFKSSLKLEPLYRSSSNGVFFFNQWLLLKVYQGVYRTLSEGRVDPPNGMLCSEEMINRITGQLELGQFEGNEIERLEFDMNCLMTEIQKVLSYRKKSRCILFLDDAAHAFSAEQQRDFFDFFRQIKSRIVSPKAAVYPGVTIYSSTFHVGHDAEQINIWMDPQSEQYVPFMLSLLEKRLPQEVFDELSKNDQMMRLMCYAAFGMPRTFLNMIRTFYHDANGENGTGYKVGFTNKSVLKAIKDSIENTISLFRSLEFKLPIYENFIRNGEKVFFEAVESVKSYNKDKPINRQSVSIGISKPLPPELAKVFGFFQYSGMVMPIGEISRGEKGVFELYALHYSALITRNALIGKKARNLTDFATALSKRDAHEFTRVVSNKLIGTSDLSTIFGLSLPPCQACHTPRINEAARFCLNCGAQLKTVSSFESIVSKDISVLTLTPQRVSTIKKTSQIRTIKDILMDHDFKELRSVPMIGKVWAKRIYGYAEESIA